MRRPTFISAGAGSTWPVAINVEGTRHVAEAARAEGVRLVHVSSHRRLGHRQASPTGRRRNRAHRRCALPVRGHQARGRDGRAPGGRARIARLDRQSRLRDRAVRLEAVVRPDAVASGQGLGPVRSAGRQQLLRRARRGVRHPGRDRSRASRAAATFWPATRSRTSRPGGSLPRSPAERRR